MILREVAGMGAFSQQQREALAMLAVRLAGTIAYLFICFYGIASMLRGYLIARAGYLPRVLGILLMIGGAGFILRSLTYMLAPQLSSPLLLMPMAVAGIPLMLWLLIKGVDTSKLEAAHTLYRSTG